MAQMISFVHGDEYAKLLDENFKLKSKITDLYLTIDQLHETIKTDKLTIQLLKEENEMLKQKINELESKMNKQDSIISNQNDLIQELKLDIQDIQLKEEYNQFMVAIQDINSMYSLEKKLKNSSFTDLREDRVDNCHYIKENDSHELKDAKITVLYEKLKYMKDSLREKFDDLYPNVIDDVLSNLTPNQTIPTKIMKRAYNWW